MHLQNNQLRVFCPISLVVLSCALISSASGQATAGAIYGTVTDLSSAVIPGAAVIATNVSTSASRTTKTDTSGDYSFPVLEPGDYNVVVQMAGFQSQTQANLRLDADQNVHVSFNGPGGIMVRPNREEERFSREPHRMALAEQMHHEREAGHNREFFASANHGHPGIAATGRPGEFSRGHMERASEMHGGGNHGFDHSARNERHVDERHMDNHHAEDHHPLARSESHEVRHENVKDVKQTQPKHGGRDR